MKKEREEKAARREKWAKRKRLPKRDPINSEIYKLLIKESEGPTYIATRTRIAICLLTVTGIRISELLSLKVGQLETLLEEGWISIDRLKRGPANHKAFLTSEGKKLVKARKRDFEFLFLMKDKDSYVFTSDRKPNQMLRRETITMDVNKVMHSVSNLLPSKPNITSHSFRIGYISQLWKDTKDIEFVRQTIGHRSLNSTSGYVTHMDDEERQNRISSIITFGCFLLCIKTNEWKSLKIVAICFCFLAIKTGLIGTNNLLESNQSDSNQQLVSSVNKVESPRYHPYLSLYNDYRPSGLLMDSIERSSLVPQYSYSQNAINDFELVIQCERGGMVVNYNLDVATPKRRLSAGKTSSICRWKDHQPCLIKILLP
jgi:site-specific recombinase XerD